MVNLLVVDDEFIFRSGLVTQIANDYKSVKVFEAENGQAALEIINSNRIDGMILDINMPKMSGLELLEKLRDDGNKKIPTIIVSGYDDFEYARRALRNEVFDYLLKPLTPNEARQTVERLLRQIDVGIGPQELGIDITREYSPLVNNVFTYVSENYMKDFSIAKMAYEFNYNANYISQLFKNETGTKLNDYIRLFRVEKAKKLLEKTTSKIGDIASEVGIDNTQYFCTVFKAAMGCTPQEYREKSNKS